MVIESLSQINELPKLLQHQVTQTFPKSIAFISDHADPSAQAGDEKACGICVYVRQVGETLARLGWKVDLFTRKVEANSPSIVHLRDDYHCRVIRLVAGPEKFIPREQLFEHMPEFLEAFKKFQAEQGLTYCIIHTNYWLAGLIGWQLKKLNSSFQWIHTYHSLGAIKYQGNNQGSASAQIRLNIEKIILENADRIIATSPQEKEDLCSLVSPNGNIEVIPCGTDINNFRLIPQANARAKLAFAQAEQIVLYVGRFDERKGIETLVRACAKSKAHNAGKLHLVIVGGSCPNLKDGQERRRIEQIVKAVGLSKRTSFPGRVDHIKLPLYYASANVCVVPSYYEPFGLITLESMACGTPVIASEVGGLQYTVVPEKTGLLIPPKDVDAFADAIDRILADEKFAHYLGQNSLVRVREHFSWARTVRLLNTLYQNLLAQSCKQGNFQPGSIDS